jgi:hypothetical protein
MSTITSASPMLTFELPAQVEGWLAAGDLMLDPADLEELERAPPVLDAPPGGEGAR